jgi:hypothetical protein
MTIDEEIKHQEEISDRYARMSEYEENNGNDGIAKDCAQCAADHRQLAEWLTDYKDLRNSVGAVRLNNMTEALKLIRKYKAENIAQKKMIAEYKRLLKAAVEDIRHCMHSYDPCEVCSLLGEDGECPATDDDDCKEKYKWRYEDEALKLIGGEADEQI